MSSQRNRKNRNGGQGEEMQLWLQAKETLRGITDTINTDTENIRNIVAQDSYIAKNKSTVNLELEDRKLEDLFRRGVKDNESANEALKAIIESLQIIRAIQESKEEAEQKTGLAGSSRSGGLIAGSARNASRAGAARDRENKEKDKDIYEFDGPADSPVPSPIGGHTRKLGGGSGGAASDRSGNRDSVPPRGGDRDTPAKADSVEPQLPSAGGGAAQRSKATFVKGQDVIFRPKPSTSANETTEWFLGKVQQVIGEKSRRYKVKDEDPDLPPEQRQEYRTSASSMIPIPPVGQELPELEKGKTVLGLYPDSTTFYKAEVMGADKESGKVHLRFEGEENSGTLQVVERRFVVEYRS